MKIHEGNVNQKLSHEHLQIRTSRIKSYFAKIIKRKVELLIFRLNNYIHIPRTAL